MGTERRTWVQAGGAAGERREDRRDRRALPGRRDQRGRKEFRVTLEFGDWSVLTGATGATGTPGTNGVDETNKTFLTGGSLGTFGFHEGVALSGAFLSPPYLDIGPGNGATSKNDNSVLRR